MRIIAFWFFFLLCVLSVVPKVSLSEEPLEKASNDLIIPKIDITSEPIIENANQKSLIDSPITRKISALVFNEYALAILITVVVIGCLLGLKGAIIIFRDYNDLGLIFILGLVPVTIGYLSCLGSSEFFLGFIFVLVLMIESAIILFIFLRTLRDNSNIFLAIIAFITKLPLSLLFLVHIINITAPSGKTFSQRASERRTALIWLMMLSPIIYKLVKNKEGFFCPDSMINAPAKIR